VKKEVVVKSHKVKERDNKGVGKKPDLKGKKGKKKLYGRGGGLSLYPNE